MVALYPIVIEEMRIEDLPAVQLVENASLPDVFTRVMTLSDLAREGLGVLEGPATLVLGEVVRHAVVSDLHRAQEQSKVA